MKWLLLCAALVIGRDAPAQDLFWQHTGGPNGSEGRAVEVSPGGVVYVGTFEDGVYRSHDRGDTWTDFGLENVHAVYDFAFSDEYIFAATWSGVFRTSPQRPAWERLVEGAAFSIAGNRDGILFAGFIDGSVLRSEDGGISWSDASDGLGESSVEPDAIEIDEEGRVLVGTASGLYLLEEDRPWTRVSADSLRVSSIVIAGRDSILIGTYGQTTRGVLFSEDSGATWTAVNGNLDQLPHVSALIADGDNGIVIGTSSGVYTSLDGGSFWTKIDAGLKEERVYDIAADDSGVLHAGMILDAGVYRFSRGAHSWEHVGLPATTVVSLAFGETGKVYAAPATGSVSVLSSVSGRWDALGQYEIGALAVGPNGELLAAESRWPPKHYLLGDDGWQTVAPASDCSSVRSFHVTSHGLYAAAVPVYPPVANSVGQESTGAPCGGIFHSDDFSRSWSDLGFDGVYMFDVIRTSRGSLVAASEDAIFTSDDDGATWEKADSPSQSRRPTALVEDGNDRLFAGTNSGVLLSSDGGTSWKVVGLEDVGIRDIAVSPAGDVIAATNEGVFRSSDEGRAWTPLEAGLPDGPVLELGLNADDYLFASVQNRGVYRSIEPIPSSIQERASEPVVGSVRARPNPSAGNVVLSFTLPEPLAVHVEIFDLLGRRVATPLNGQYRPAGAHEILWSTETHASGLYVYRVSGTGLTMSGTVLLTK